MRSTVLFCSIAVGLLFCSCNPRITTELVKVATPLPINQDVAVIDLDEEIPANGEVIGEVTIDDAGMANNCSYDYVLELAKAEARKAGGNALKIEKHLTPDMSSSCHRISASILYIQNVASGLMVLNASDSMNSDNSVKEKSFIMVTDPRLRLSLHGGLSEFLVYNPMQNDPVIHQYNEELLSGVTLGTDFTYYFSDYVGIGIKCNMVRTSNSLSGVTLYDNYGHSYYGSISDDITALYVGPTVNLRKTIKENNSVFSLSASVGYNGYHNEAFYFKSFTANGATLGSSFDVCYDLNVSKKLSMGLKLSLTTGLLKSLTFSNEYSRELLQLDESSMISLNHIDFTFGFCFIR